MLDLRFYDLLGAPTVSQLAATAGVATTRGGADRIITSFAAANASGPADLTFFDSREIDGAGNIRAAACFVRQDAAAYLDDSVSGLVCEDPRQSFGRAIASIAQQRQLPDVRNAIPTKTSVADTAILEQGVVLGDHVSIGEGSRIGANAVIGPGVQIGRDCRIGANVTIYCTLIGDNVSILAGAAIGETGFGLSSTSSGLLPHFGRVILQDGVSVGANSCIDRGMLEDTVIGERTHIDNLCHIGHNVRIGARTAMAAFAGISGSSLVGDDVLFGGRVGLGDHVKVGSGARIAAGAAVLSDVPAGATHAGYPAKPIRTWMRELAWLARAAQKRPSGKD